MKESYRSKHVSFRPGAHFFEPKILSSKVLFGTTHFHGVNYTYEARDLIPIDECGFIDDQLTTYFGKKPVTNNSSGIKVAISFTAEL
jgi:hypothetical protein